MTDWATAFLPYALLATSGAYLAGIAMLLLRKWDPPVGLPGWAVLLALVAFVIDRETPYALQAAPVVYLCAIFIVARIVGSPGLLSLRNLLWSLFALIPIAFMLDVSIAGFFPQTDAAAMRIVAELMLTIPGIAALLAAIARAISPAPRT